MGRDSVGDELHVGAGAAEDAADPELLALPDPPKRDKALTVILLVVTAFASIAMACALRHDAAYAFAPETATELGDLRTAAASTLEENRYVHGQALVGAAGAIRYEHALEGDSYRAMPVAGRPDIWVELRVPAGVTPERFVPPTSLAGRLVRMDASGPRHRGLAQSITELTGQEVPADAWLLVDGEAPKNARWAVMLVALFAVFAAWNGAAVARLLRRVK